MSQKISIFLGTNGSSALAPKIISPLGDEGAYASLLEMFKAQIQFDRDSGLDAATRDLQSAQSMAMQGHTLRDALLEIFALLFPVLRDRVQQVGWTPETVRQLEHLRRRCEAFPVEREREELLDLLDEYRRVSDETH